MYAALDQSSLRARLDQMKQASKQDLIMHNASMHAKLEWLCLHTKLD